MSGEGNLQFYRKGRMGNDDRVGPTELGAYVYSVVTWYIYTPTMSITVCCNNPVTGACMRSSLSSSSTSTSILFGW